MDEVNEAQYFTSQGQVICQVCKKGFQVIGATHLAKHNMTMETYKEKFPEVPLSAKSFSARAKFRDLEGFAGQNEDTFQETVSNLPDSKEIRQKAKELEQVEVKEEKPKNLPPILKSKVDIIDFLKNMYSSVTENYFIEKRNLSGLLEYSYITDIVDLNSKTNFEFPQAFWHNRDARQDRLRDEKLKTDGWTVIRINEHYPTTDDLKKSMDIVF